MDLSKEELNPDKIFYWLNGQYGKQWYLWEPETLLVDLKRYNISSENWQKVLALRLVTVSERPWEEYDIFEKTALAFNDIIVDFKTMESVTAQQMAYAIYVMRKVKPQTDFGEDVKKWIACNCFINHSLVYLDPPLSISQIYINQLLKDFPTLQLLQKEVKTRRNVKNPENDALRFQISELDAIIEYVRKKDGYN